MRARSNFFAACLTGLLAAGALAQAPSGPITPKVGAKQEPPKQQAPEQGRIRVKVELVTTPVTVRDASGELIYDLERKDFRVFDDGVEQKIEDFDMGGGPLSVVIVMRSEERRVGKECRL